MSKNFKQFSKAIWEKYEVVEEENKPTNPELWARAKSMAKKKFDVYPSAYANGWASKWYKSKGGGWKSVSEAIEPEKKDEYDGEVDMAKNQLKRIVSHAQHFHDMLTDKDQNLPEWVQSKITKAEDYISSAHDYMMGEMQEETILESLGNHGALTNYANSSKAGIDKKDFHTAAKYMKAGQLNKLKSHLANMDTDPRDHVIKHIDKKHHKALGYHMSEATYTAVHAKHGTKTVQADSTYGAAKAAASHWNTGKKGTQGIDVHLHTDKPKAYTEAVVRLDPKSFLKVKGPSSAYDAGYTAAKSGKKYGENPHPKGSKEHLDWSKAHNQARANKIHGEEVDLEEANFQITYKNPQFSKPQTHTIKARNADHAQTKFLSYGNPYKVHSVKKVNEDTVTYTHKDTGAKMKSKFITDVAAKNFATQLRSQQHKNIEHHKEETFIHPDHQKELDDPKTPAARKAYLNKLIHGPKDDNSGDHEAWKEKRQAALKGRHYHEEKEVPALLKKEGYYKDIATNKAEDERLAKQKKTNYPPHMDELLKKARAYDKKHPLPKNEAVTKTIKPGQGYKMEEAAMPGRQVAKHKDVVVHHYQGVGHVYKNGKKIASGDYDELAGGYFMSKPGEKGQRFFDNEHHVAKHYAESIEESALSRVMSKLKDIETRKSFETGQSRIPTPDERRRQLSKRAQVVKEAAKKKKQKPETFEAEPELTSDVQIKGS